jgi:hypothetical protein
LRFPKVFFWFSKMFFRQSKIFSNPLVSITTLIFFYFCALKPIKVL